MFHVKHNRQLVGATTGKYDEATFVIHSRVKGPNYPYRCATFHIGHTPRPATRHSEPWQSPRADGRPSRRCVTPFRQVRGQIPSSPPGCRPDAPPPQLVGGRCALKSGVSRAEHRRHMATPTASSVGHHCYSKGRPVRDNAVPREETREGHRSAVLRSASSASSAHCAGHQC